MGDIGPLDPNKIKITEDGGGKFTAIFETDSEIRTLVFSVPEKMLQDKTKSNSPVERAHHIALNLFKYEMTARLAASNLGLKKGFNFKAGDVLTEDGLKGLNVAERLLPKSPLAKHNITDLTDLIKHRKDDPEAKYQAEMQKPAYKQHKAAHKLHNIAQNLFHGQAKALAPNKTAKQQAQDKLNTIIAKLDNPNTINSLTQADLKALSEAESSGLKINMETFLTKPAYHSKEY